MVRIPSGVVTMEFQYPSFCQSAHGCDTKWKFYHLHNWPDDSASAFPMLNLFLDVYVNMSRLAVVTGEAYFTTSYISY